MERANERTSTLWENDVAADSTNIMCECVWLYVEVEDKRNDNIDDDDNDGTQYLNPPPHLLVIFFVHLKVNANVVTQYEYIFY